MFRLLNDQEIGSPGFPNCTPNSARLLSIYFYVNNYYLLVFRITSRTLERIEPMIEKRKTFQKS